MKTLFFILLSISIPASALDLSIFANYSNLETTETGGDTNVRAIGADLKLNNNVHIVGFYGDEISREDGSLITGLDVDEKPIRASTTTPELSEYIRADLRVGATAGDAFIYVAPVYTLLDFVGYTNESVGYAAGFTASQGNLYGGFEYVNIDSDIDGISVSFGVQF